MNYKTILVILITLVGTFLRLYKLGDIPNSYTPDEVAQGYTAYSILNTSKDEWGSNNWFLLKSFGDYKPPLQTLLMIPSIKFLGLTPFATRLPNALLSSLTIPIFYLLTKKFFEPRTALISTILICTSPWLFPMSRLALEASLLIFFLALAILLFLENRYLLSTIPFALTLYTYHSSKIFTPLIIILLLIFIKKHLPFKKICFFLATFCLLVAPLFLFSNYPSRTSDIAIFNPTDNWASVSNEKYNLTQFGLPNFIARLLSNKATYTVKVFLTSYFSFFSPQFLITNGAGETTYGMFTDHGVLGLIPFIGLIVSVYFFIKGTPDKKNLTFLFAALLLSPLAASLAKGYYAANRTSVMAPFLIILSSYGLSKISNLKWPIIILFLISSAGFIIKYFYLANNLLAHGMLYGHKEAIDYINSIKPTSIIYSRKLSEPQAYVLFFNKIDPKITQAYTPQWQQFQTRGHQFLDQLSEYQIENYNFKEINFASDSLIPNTILIGRPEEFPGIKPTKIIFYPSFSEQKPAIYIYHTKNAI